MKAGWGDAELVVHFLVLLLLEVLPVALGFAGDFLAAVEKARSANPFRRFGEKQEG